jgi:myo-inositol-1(or 4)-monophosphatase
MIQYDRVAEVGASTALEAGKLLMERLKTGFAISHKGATNLVTEVDLAAEELIVSRLRESFPDHTILAEEKHSQSAPGPCTWIIDPLDGTTNYAHGFPAFAVSIGFEAGGRLEWGAVYNPNLGELFTARRGEGAFLNSEPVRVSRTGQLGDSLLATGFPYDIRTSAVTNLEYFAEFAKQSRGIRRAGSAALDFAYVAAGRLDGFWELKLSPWDCAAGYLLVREAGGVVTNLQGDEGSIYERQCVVSNGYIHGQMLSAIRSVDSLTKLS